MDLSKCYICKKHYATKCSVYTDDDCKFTLATDDQLVEALESAEKKLQKYKPGTGIRNFVDKLISQNQIEAIGKELNKRKNNNG
jgi:hypothetical protein